MNGGRSEATRQNTAIGGSTMSNKWGVEKYNTDRRATKNHKQNLKGK